MKRGRRGDPTSSNAVPKVGYVSGTKTDICVCLPNSSNGDEEVCPVSYSKPVYPWKPRKNKPDTNRGNRRCTDTNGVVIPCSEGGNRGGNSCFDVNGVRIAGCRGDRNGYGGVRGRGGGDGDGDGGVYRYDYDDYDVRQGSFDRNRDGIDDGIQGDAVTVR